MFQDLVELGKAKFSGSADPLILFTENIGENYTVGISINFNKDGDKYLGCSTEDFSGEEKRKRVLYKSGPSNGFDPLPVTKFSGKTHNVVERIKKYLTAVSEFVQNEKFMILLKTYNRNMKAIEDQVAKKINDLNLSLKKGAFIYINIGSNPLWNYVDVRNFFLSWVPRAFEEKEGTRTAVESAYCYLCNKKRPLVYGNVSLVPCYHLDQPGTIAGGCTLAMGVKNFPICFECAGFLSKGFDYASNNLSFFMGDLKYLLLPSFSDKNTLNIFIRMLEKRDKEAVFAENKLGPLTSKEDSLFRYVANRFSDKNALSLRMVFYTGIQNKWRILAEIEKILPSRLKIIYEAKREYEALPFLKKNDKPDHISMYLIQKICRKGPDSRKSPKIDSKFLSYVSAIFGGGKIYYKHVLHDLVIALSNEYWKDSDIKYWLARHSLLLLYFLNKIRVITLPEGGKMERKELPAKTYVNFMNEHNSFFGTPEKRIAFLTGALIGQILYEGPSSHPFRRHLGDYRFDKRKLSKLRPIIEEKIAAYDRDKGTMGKTRELRALLDICWSESAEIFQGSEDELTLATIMGMNLNDHIVKMIISEHKIKKGENNGNN